MTAIRSWNGYATILRCLQEQPRTAHQLSVDLSANKGGLQILLGRMCDLGLIHESGWVQVVPRARMVPVWAFGKVGRVPYPSTGKLPERRPNAYRHRPQLIAFATIIRALVHEPVTALRLAEVTGCDRNQLYKLLLHCEGIGLARVSGWEVRDTCHGKPSAIWALANGIRPRAKRPRVLTRQQIDARNWAKRAARRDMLRISSALTRPMELEAA